jgi:hypothetical protein
MRISTLLTSAAAVAFLSTTPLSAQVGTGHPEVHPPFELDERLSSEDRATMYERFYGIDRPAPPQALDVPPEVAEVFPDAANYQWITLPDGRIALINRETGNIATVL